MASTKPHYHLSAGLHSGETNTSEMLMELTYRLAVSDEPYIQQIRDNVIVSMVPTTDIDGRDRYVDWYYAYKIDEPYDGGENFGGPPYWGKYVFHDNNRDINYGVDTLRTYLKWYLEWVPPIWHDLHEAQTLLYTYSGGAPQNANWDPLLYSDLMFFANYEVSKMTGYGMPGVWHFGFMDAWSPGYLAIAAQNHNGMLRMYEIFNQGGANTKKARLQGNQTTRQWYRPNPASGEVDWSIRNSINYSQTAVLTALELTSKVPGMVVENYYKKAVNAVNRGLSKAPHAFVIPAGQGDQTKVDRMANLLRVQAIEVHRATSEVKVKEGTFPAGSFIVRLNQPYGPLAKTLLEKQVYPDPALQTYDDSAWTMGLANNVEVKTIEDKTILDAPAALLTADVVTNGAVTGSGDFLVVKHNGALNLVTLRYRLKDVGFKGATASFKVGDEDYPAGSFIIPASDRARQEIQKLGLVATALPSAPEVATADVDLPRLAIFTTWSNTEKVGWVRLAFDRFEVPFDLIHKDHVRARQSAREVRRHRHAPPGQQRQEHRLRATEAFQALGLPQRRHLQDVRLLHGDRRRPRRNGARRRSRVPEVCGRGWRADDAWDCQRVPGRVRDSEGCGHAERAARFLRARAVRAERDHDSDAPGRLRLRPEDPAGSLRGRSAAAGGSSAGGRGVPGGVTVSTAGGGALCRRRGWRVERRDARRRSDPESPDDRRCAIGEGARAAVHEQSDLSLADVRRARDGVQRADVLERSAGVSAAAKPVPTAQ